MDIKIDTHNSTENEWKKRMIDDLEQWIPLVKQLRDAEAELLSQIFNSFCYNTDEEHLSDNTDVFSVFLGELDKRLKEEEISK